jgi:hypothetical protein
MNGQAMNNQEPQSKTLTLVGSVYYKPGRTFRPYSWMEVESDARFWTDNHADYVLIGPYTIEIEMPEGFDPMKETLKALQHERTLVLADNEQRLNSIDEKIQQLLAIEHKPDESTPFD